MIQPNPKFSLVKIFQILIYHILFPIVAMILFSLISKIITGNWLQLFKMIPITVWIIVGLIILIWILIIIYYKKIIKLESKKDTLKEKFKIEDNIIFENNVCWIKKKDGSKEGPFCSVCIEKDGKPIHLHCEEQDPDTYYCPACGTGVHRKIRVSSTKKPS